MVERRHGGETGVKSMQAYRGDKFWAAMKEGVWPRDLMESALSRSHTLTPAREGFNDIMPTMEDMQRLVKNPVAYRYEHNDGLNSTMLLMSGLVKDFNFASRLDKGILSTQMYLPMPDGRTTLANFFSPLGEQHGADVPHGQSQRTRLSVRSSRQVSRRPGSIAFSAGRPNWRHRTLRSNIRRLVSRRSGEAE